MDGVVGLAPDDPTNGPSYIVAMKTAGLIDNAMFGFLIGESYAINSTITFGGYDTSKLP